MKRASKFLSLLLALAMVCSLAVPAVAAEETGEKGNIVILHTNDVHCAIDQVKDEEGGITNIGYAGVAALKAEMEAAYGDGNVTLVDAGDAIQGGPIGTLSKGSYIVDIMNQVGYDLAVPGNHEFDYGMENFLTLAGEKAEYPYLCSNFVDKDGKPVFDAYKVVDYGQTQVAYVGIDTPEAFTKSTPTYFQDAEGKYIYGFSEGNDGKDLYASVQKAVDAARAEGADYVVAIGHLGIDDQSKPWTSTEVVANTTGIDVLIDGHSHSTFDNKVANKAGDEVVVAQTGTKLANVGRIVINPKTGDITADLVEGYATQDVTTAAFITKINEEFDGILKEVVAKSDVALTTLDANGQRAVRNAETNLGDLCADAYRVMLGADVAFVNGGGVRADIKAGEITYEDIINVHPFGNEACLVEATGQQLLDALEMGARSVPGENGGFLQVSGLTYTIDSSIASSVQLNDKKEFVSVDGEYRVKDVMIGGVAIDLAKTYTLASHNFMIKSGGDGFVMFKGNKLLKDSVMLDNAVLINYIVDELGGVVGSEYAAPQGRITVKNVGVEPGAWYADAARYVMDKGIMTSTGAGFDPTAAVTRATIFQMLHNMEGKPAAAATVADTAGQWYAGAINWAASVKIFDGTSFGTDGVIARAELAQVIADYAAYKGLPATEGGMAMKEAPDYDQIPAQYLEGMSYCYYAGLMKGDQSGRLNPTAGMTRAELAQVMLNFSKLVPAITTEHIMIKNGDREIPAVVTLPAGNGPFPAVVMNHGHGGSKDENVGFIGIAEALADQGIASIRMDFPGCGESKASFAENCLSNMISDSNACKDYLVANYAVDKDQLGILGYSMGGRIAATIANEKNSPYQAMVLLAGAVGDGKEMAVRLAGGADKYDAVYADAVKNGFHTITTQYGQELDMSKTWFDDMNASTPLKNAANFTKPVLVIYGDKDDVVPAAVNELSVKAYPQAETVVVPGADHGYAFYNAQPAVTALVEGSISDFFAESLIPAAADKAA